jgi:hypothetical protein
MRKFVKQKALHSLLVRYLPYAKLCIGVPEEVDV